MPQLALAIAQHPIGGLAPEAMRSKAIELLGHVVSGLTTAKVTA